jgi:hypothetical protein
MEQCQAIVDFEFGRMVIIVASDVWVERRTDMVSQSQKPLFDRFQVPLALTLTLASQRATACMHGVLEENAP